MVTMFATEFTVFLTVNLEREEDRAIFERTDSVKDILNAIYLLKEPRGRILSGRCRFKGIKAPFEVKSHE